MSLISLIVSFLFILASNNPAEAPYNLGDAVLDFELMGVSEESVKLSDAAGDKGVILIFSCNECPYVHKYEQRMIDLHNTYAPQGWPVVAISSNDPARMKGNSYKNMKRRAAEMEFPFAYVYDKDQEQLRRFGATKTPEVFLLTKQGEQLTLAYTGAIDDNPRNAEGVDVKYVEDAIASLEAGEEVTTKKTKAIGCGIRPLKSLSK